MRKNLQLLQVFVFLFTAETFAQTNDSASHISYSAYIDAYYAYYTDSVGEGNYEKFPSVSPRSEFGLNSMLFTVQYDAEKVRAIASLHFGDIPGSAWSSEFNSVMEAHAGVRLCKKLWFDAGFFRTHIGAEGLLPKENIASSISTCTFYEPYYESGIRLNYLPCDKFTLNFYVLNGYSIFTDNNKKKSFGLLATYTINDNSNIGYANYIGDDTPGSSGSVLHLRMYHNLILNYQVSKLKIQLGLDYAMQENSKLNNQNNSASMFSGLLGLKYQANEKFAVYARGEMFNDPDGFLSGVIFDKSGKFTGYKITGGTLGAEYKPTDHSYIRIEGRQIQMNKDQEIFLYKGENKSSRLEMMLNLGVSF